MNLKKRFVNAAVAAMLMGPVVAIAAPQVVTTGGSGAAGPVNLFEGVGNAVPVPLVATGTAIYMSEIAVGATTFSGGTALDVQSLTGAGITANNQAHFRYDLIGGTFGGAIAATALDMVIPDPTAAAFQTAAVNAAIAGALAGFAVANNDTVTPSVLGAAEEAAMILAAQTAAAGLNSAAAEAAAIAAAKLVQNQTPAAMTAAQQTAVGAALGGVITGVATSPALITINNTNNPGSVTVLQGGGIGSTSVIFQVNITGILYANSTPVTVGQADRVDMRVPSIVANTAPARVDYEYHMYAGGNGGASATNNNRAAALSSASAIAINTAPAQLTTIAGNATPAVIDVATQNKNFVANTRQILTGEAGLQIGSQGVGDFTGAALNNNVYPTAIAAGTNPAGAIGALAQITGVANTTGLANAGVIGAISTQNIAGSPAIGSFTVAHGSALDPNGAAYGVVAAGGNGDTVSLTITSADPAGFDAFATTPATAGTVFMDNNANNVFDGGDVAAATVIGGVATFPALSPAQAASGNNIVITEDGTITMVPTTFSASVQYNFGITSFVAGTFANPTAVVGAFGSTVKNGSTRVADTVPASNNPQGKVGYIRVTNRSAQAGNVTVTVYRNDGTLAVPAGTPLVVNLAPNATYTIGTGFVGGAGGEIDSLAGTPGVASFTGRARVVVTGEFPAMDVQSTVSSPAGVPVQTNLSAHAGS